ncbi:Lipoamide acyltransferase component of branched-chain alpha-keto acid dehydrogenase complex, mitocho [Smittium culicis]|uniref:Dihydrolipoamide acetyltransferase component of pyruvate dehydrogenase complex n=1 Tax=Smittium culicis TaxID=133412 RepID=A0A1R1Y3D2_9FUNG|nr:Lipoamide acyltransferase component of branched-chain alpha-keto acid dehydrogenase complex, mitocho [Smittium culicis]
MLLRNIAKLSNFRAIVVPYKLADIGEGITECEIIQWYVKVGDKVSQFDKICEVQSDKATVEITSRYDGIIKDLLYAENDIALVGTPLLNIDLDNEADAPSELQDVAAPSPLVDEAQKQQHNDQTRQSSDNTITKINDLHTKIENQTTHQNQADSKLQEHQQNSSQILINHDRSLIHSTPAVRFFAKEKGIDLGYVKGTGKNGRITKDDILAYAVNPTLQTSSPQPIPSSIPTSINHTHAATPQQSSPPHPIPVTNQKNVESVVKLTNIQKSMLKTMTNALSIPHFGLSEEIDMGKVIECRNDINSYISKHNEQAKKISYLPFFVKAASLSLLEYPILNARLVTTDSQGLALKDPYLIYNQSHNIGIAIDSSYGLLVPNIKDVQNKSLLEISKEISILQQHANSGSLSVEALKNPTFTLSSVGNLSGATVLSPVIVPNQVCIGAFGKINTIPRFRDSNADDMVIVKKHLLLTNWRADHRIIDGATLSRFSAKFKHLLENPAIMMANMI